MRLVTLLLAVTLGTGFNLSSGAPAYPQGAMGGHLLTQCDVHAYVIDRDPKGMNVRSGPGSSFKIIGNLPNENVDGIMVHITGSKGDWMRIDLAEEAAGEERTFFKGEGWLYGPLLGVDGIGSGTNLYRQPMARSRIAGNLPGGSEEGATVRGCQGKWMYVEHKNLRAWAAPGTLCFNPLTTCP